MKKRLLVAMLVLSFVLVGCGQTDYTDVDLYKDKIVQKYNEIDKDFLKNYDEALNKTGIKEGVENFMDSSLDFIDEALDLTGDNAKEYYDNFEKGLDDITEVPFSQEDMQKFVDDFEVLSDKRQEQVSSLVNGILNKAAKEVDKMTKYIKNLSAEEFKKFKDGVDALVDEGEDLTDAVSDYIANN